MHSVANDARGSTRRTVQRTFSTESVQMEGLSTTAAFITMFIIGDLLSAHQSINIDHVHGGGGGGGGGVSSLAWN